MSNMAFSGRGASLITGTSIIAEITNMSDIMATLGKVDTTAHNNVGAFKTYRPGFADIGELTVDMNYVAQTAQDTLLSTALGTVSTWTLVAPMALSRAWSFNGYLSGAGTPKFDKDGNCSMSIRIQPSGVITPLTTAATGLTTPFLSITDQGSTALTLSPTAAGSTYGYSVAADLADTGVKVTATASAGTLYVNNALATSGAATAAITIPATAGDHLMIPVVVFESGKVPKVYWIDVLHNYV